MVSQPPMHVYLEQSQSQLNLIDLRLSSSGLWSCPLHRQASSRCKTCARCSVQMPVFRPAQPFDRCAVLQQEEDEKQQGPPQCWGREVDRHALLARRAHKLPGADRLSPCAMLAWWILGILT